MHNLDLSTSSISQRRDQLYSADANDPYLTAKKRSEPTHCPDCGAVYHRGRWQWADDVEIGVRSESHHCPACERVRDRFPAGFLALSGDFFVDHKEEILHLIKNLERREIYEHALERIMEMDELTPGHLSVSYSGQHLALATGKALHHAYQGKMKVEHNERSGQIRVHWER